MPLDFLDWFPKLPSFTHIQFLVPTGTIYLMRWERELGDVLSVCSVYLQVTSRNDLYWDPVEKFKRWEKFLGFLSETLSRQLNALIFKAQMQGNIQNHSQSPSYFIHTPLWALLTAPKHSCLHSRRRYRRESEREGLSADLEGSHHVIESHTRLHLKTKPNVVVKKSMGEMKRKARFKSVLSHYHPCDLWKTIFQNLTFLICTIGI